MSIIASEELLFQINVGSVLLEHHFSGFDDYFNLVTLLEVELLGALARDHTFQLVLSHADRDMGHDVP